MANELTNYLSAGNLPEISDADMMAGLSEIIDDSGEGSGPLGFDFMSFSGKTGRYAVGRDKEEIDPGQLFLLEPKAVVEGWTCWKGNRPVDRVEWGVFNRAANRVSKDDLDDHGPYRENMGEGWKKTLGLGVSEISSDEGRQQIKFTTNSASGNNAIKDILKKIVERVAAGEPHIPLVFFDSETFTAQDQTNYKPKLVVDAWVGRVAVTAFFAGEMSEDEMVEGVPKKKTRKRGK